MRENAPAERIGRSTKGATPNSLVLMRHHVSCQCSYEPMCNYSKIKRFLKSGSGEMDSECKKVLGMS